MLPAKHLIVNLKMRILICAIAVLGLSATIQADAPTFVRDTVEVKVVEPVQGLTINGPKEVVSGNFLKLVIDGGPETKIVDGVRVPKVGVAIDPPTENLIIEDSGYRLYLTEPLGPSESFKEFVVTASVNNPDPNGAPLSFSRKFRITRGLEPDPGPNPPPPGPLPPPGPSVDDRFDNLGKAVAGVAGKYPKAERDALAKAYGDAATGLEDGTHATLPAAQKTLIAVRRWEGLPDVATVVSTAWNKFYPTMDKVDYIDFCRAVAGGLR